MEKLRQKRINAIGRDEYSKLVFSNISMDSFEDLLLGTFCFNYEGEGDANDGICTLHNGLSSRLENSECCVVDALQAYTLLYDQLQEPETYDKTKQRIQEILGNRTEEDEGGEPYEFDLYFKNPQNMLVKTFIRRKRLNDAVRTTIVCTLEEERLIRDNLETGLCKKLRDNGMLCVKDDLFSKKAWPVLKLIMPVVSYIYYNEEDEENMEWTRMIYGIEIHITGQDFMDLKEDMHVDYEQMRIDVATRDFLDLRPFQMNNMNLIIAFCRAMS